MNSGVPVSSVRGGELPTQIDVIARAIARARRLGWGVAPEIDELGGGRMLAVSASICGSTAAQPHDRRAEMRLGRVPELGDERVSAQEPLDGGALHALAAPVNQPHDRRSPCRVAASR